MSHPELQKHRAGVLSSMIQRAKELARQEQQDLQTADPVVAQINKHKRLRLFSELLTSSGHPDKDLVSELRSGFHLTGWGSESGFLPKKFKPMTLQATCLEAMSREIGLASLRKACSTGDSDLDAALSVIIKEELDKGWVSGPLDPQELEPGSVISPRFPIRQGEKVRAIDDFSFSGVNSCFGTTEKIELQGVDDILSLIGSMLRSGRGALHGRTFDMESAYRQLAIHPLSRSKAYVAAFDPGSSSAKLYRLQSMPFGAVASVFAFIRTAAALNRLLCQLLLVPVTNYFDDFTVISPSSLSEGTSDAVHLFFQLIGFQLSQSEKKNRPFAQVFQALGVGFDLSKAPMGVVEVQNTKERVDDLMGRIAKILDQTSVSSSEAKSLRSRLNFAEGQIYGRMAAAVLKELGQYENGQGQTTLTGKTKALLRFMQERLTNGLPRRLDVNKAEVIHVFTDGAKENSDDDSSAFVGIGAVLVTHQGTPIEAFGLSIPDDLAKKVGTHIHQFEILPVLLACIAFDKRLEDMAVMFHIDNSAAQSALINAGSRNADSRSIVYAYLAIEQKLRFRPWFARVGSHSNVSDGPSRQDFQWLKEKGVKTYNFPLQAFEYVVEQLLVNASGQNGDK